MTKPKREQPNPPTMALLNRLANRGRLPCLMRGPRGDTVATDGHCAVIVTGDHGAMADLVSGAAEVLYRDPLWRRDDLARLRDWAGPAPRAVVEPCPDWKRHEQGAPTCYWECQFVLGLGFAHETQSPDFACYSRDGLGWGSFGDIVLDRVRLAEALAPWEDGPVEWATMDNALYVQRSDEWRIVLMGGAAHPKPPTLAELRKLAREVWGEDTVAIEFRGAEHWECGASPGNIQPSEGVYAYHPSRATARRMLHAALMAARGSK